MQQLRKGTLLQNGKYKIVKVLGQGGFGITYLAEQVQLGRQVAIKEFYMSDYCERNRNSITIPTVGGCATVDQYHKKFVKEAKKLATLHHPNIVEVLDIFEENNTVYYVMTYQSGGSLQNYMNHHGRMDEQTAIHYIKQIASALDYMHQEKHMCHFDIKPGNIMLDGHGNALLIDFGLAKGYDNSGMQTSTTPVGLSVNFTPIEQYQQNVEEFSSESDIYSLGATAYYLLTGKMPPSAIERISGVTIDYSGLNDNVRAAINKAMSISKNDRWKSMRQFIQSLDYYTNESSTQYLEERTIASIRNTGIFNGSSKVTQKEWKAVMGDNPSRFKGDDFPVECVTWNDCQTFINKLNSLTGKRFRLPTEFEWEYAARGGNKSKGYKYAGSNNINDVAWYGNNSGKRTHKVGEKNPNELGLYDMSGNVYEWCQDCVFRGGSWCYESIYRCVSSRGGCGPQKAGLRGFRLAL